MSPILTAWNSAEPEQAAATLLSCCAAQRWAEALIAQRPFNDEDALFTAADQVWATMLAPDWMQAFAAHPRIGEGKVAHATEQSLRWSGQEQSNVQQTQAEVLAELATANRRYEEQFGFTYIVCATGKSAQQMLSNLLGRLGSDRETELREAAEQQRQITRIRMTKWLQP